MARSPEPIVERVRVFLEARELLPAPGPILIALSGGPDSVCLFHILRGLGVPVQAAHLDHQSRGGGSTEDAFFVESLTKRLRVPLYLRHEDVQGAAAESSLSFEEYARNTRYAFLVETAKLQGSAAIATGHHADDQAETILMRILRGTTPHGLGGIPADTMRDGVRVIRPLLSSTRSEILHYLRENRHEFCTDPTNESLDVVRNRVRHELLPALEREFNPRVRDALLRLGAAAETESGMLSEMTDRFLRASRVETDAIARDIFREGHRAIQRRALVRIASEYGVDMDLAHVDRAVDFILSGGSGKRFDLGGGVTFENARDRTMIVASDTTGGAETECALAIPGETHALGLRWVARERDEPPAEPLDAYCTPGRQVFDADAFTGPAMVRYRRAGDRFVPFGMHGRKKLKDFFSDLGVPRAERDRTPLVVANGEVLWVVGYAIAAKGAVTDATRRVYELEVTDAAQ